MVGVYYSESKIADEITAQLIDQETILAWLPIDLDTQLHFSPGLIVVTNKRLLAKMLGDEAWQAWHYRNGLSLTQRDYA